VDFERPSTASLTIDRDRLYNVYFHGPSYRVLDGVELADGRAVGVMAAGLPPDVAPADAEKVIDPRMIELCFQTAGAWLLARKETMALPSRVDSISVPDPPPAPPGRSLFALVDALGGGEAFDAKVVDDQGRVYLELSGYRTVPLPERRTLGS
jgi:hypothetical protein